MIIFINGDKIKVIYNPSALGITKPTQNKLKLYSESLWKPKYKFKFLGVGSLKEQKNFSLLIEAFSKLELIIAQEQELASIGHQAAAAAHSLGTPLSTITVVAKELKNEISKNSKKN